MKIFRTKIFSLICVFLVLSYFGTVRSAYGDQSEGDVDFAADQPDDPNCYITAVTTDPSTISQGLSLAGGANLYIQGSGFKASMCSLTLSPSIIRTSNVPSTSYSLVMIKSYASFLLLTEKSALSLVLKLRQLRLANA